MEITLELLEKAYNAGVDSIEKNKNIDKLLDDGTKQCPERPSFKNWYNNIEALEDVDEKKFDPNKSYCEHCEREISDSELDSDKGGYLGELLFCESCYDGLIEEQERDAKQSAESWLSLNINEIISDGEKRIGHFYTLEVIKAMELYFKSQTQYLLTRKRVVAFVEWISWMDIVRDKDGSWTNRTPKIGVGFSAENTDELYNDFLEMNYLD